MKTGEKITNCFVIIIMILSIVTLSGCIELSNDKDTFSGNLFLSGFEVHEWGVFFKEYDSNISYLLNPDANFDDSYVPPFIEPPVVYPLKPVIYFHYENNISYVTVEVEISEDLVTIPNATIVGDKIQWTFALENNSVVFDNDSVFDYLFYEGRVDSDQNLNAFVMANYSNVTFYIKNTADYPISNIFFTHCHPYNLPYGTGDILPSIQDIITSESNSDSDSNDDSISYFPYERDIIITPYWYPPLIARNYVYIEQLNPGESILITKPRTYNSDCFNYSLIRNVLKNTGLTEKETDELMDYWEDIWFEPQIIFDKEKLQWKQDLFINGDSAQILYMIPQNQYDRLLPINIIPAPDVIKRVGLYYVTGIPCPNDPLFYQVNVLSMNTDKKIYELHETINLTVKNTFVHSFFTTGASCLCDYPEIAYSLLRFVNGSFQNFPLVQGDISFGGCVEEVRPCVEYTAKNESVLKIRLVYNYYNESGSFEKKLPLGIYKVEMTFCNKCENGYQGKDCFKNYSNMFAIV